MKITATIKLEPNDKLTTPDTQCETFLNHWWLVFFDKILPCILELSHSNIIS